MQSNFRFIIEEPELNLYPTTQKLLLEYLIEKCTKGDNRLIVTTHSLYIPFDQLLDLKYQHQE